MVARTPKKRMYRTMQGRMIDIEKLRGANENERAVGNMNVNARGDVLNKSGQVVTSKAKVIQKYYEQPKGKVDDTPRRSKPVPVKRTPPQPTSIQTQKKTTVASKPQQTRVAKKATTQKKGIDAALDGLE